MRQLQNRVARLEQRIGTGGQRVRVIYRGRDMSAGDLDTAKAAAEAGGAMVLVVSFVAPGAVRVTA